MNIFVYGDESGVFDYIHNDVFVFGGLIFLSKKDRDNEHRRYIAAEKKIAPFYGTPGGKTFELKASTLSKKHKAGLFRSTNKCIRYAFIVRQKFIKEEIFHHKKSKQRYLDYVFKVGLKRTLERLIMSGVLNPDDVDNVYVRFDEHATATDGRYELREALEAEFKFGTFNYHWNVFHKPIFPNMKGIVELEFRDSTQDALIRASDIIANYAWYHELSNRMGEVGDKLFLVRFP